MADDQVNTVQLNGWVDRMRAGDRRATDELLRAVDGRRGRLARKMFQRFPDVHRWSETGDVRPASTRDFFGLAAEQMRRELLDLARHVRGPMAADRHDSGAFAGSDSSHAADPAAPTEPGAELDQWAAFHAAVERLPVEEREVVGLIFYHGWTQAQVAELFQVSVRTVQRRWEDASVKLRRTIEGTAP